MSRDEHYRDPRTPGEWSDAVDTAHALLLLDASRQYGLLTGGPSVNIDRCDAILKAGAVRGIHPSPYAVDRFIAAYNNGTPAIS